MKTNFSRLLLFFLFAICPVFGQASDLNIHFTDQILFEVFKNGVLSNERISLQINAGKGSASQSAECYIVVITGNDLNKRIELNSYYASSTLGSINNLDVGPTAISFQMIPFPLSPDRPIRFVATRDNSLAYTANAVGLWTVGTRKPELLKIEWRQVPSITLPYFTIGK